MNRILQIQKFRELESGVVQTKQQLRCIENQICQGLSECNHIGVFLKYKEFPYYHTQMCCLICGEKLFSSDTDLSVQVDVCFENSAECDVAFEQIQKRAMEIAYMHPEFSEEEVVAELNQLYTVKEKLLRK